MLSENRRILQGPVLAFTLLAMAACGDSNGNPSTDGSQCSPNTWDDDGNPQTPCVAQRASPVKRRRPHRLPPLIAYAKHALPIRGTTTAIR